MRGRCPNFWRCWHRPKLLITAAGACADCGRQLRRGRHTRTRPLGAMIRENGGYPEP